MGQYNAGIFSSWEYIFETADDGIGGRITGSRLIDGQHEPSRKHLFVKRVGWSSTALGVCVTPKLRGD